MTQAEPEATFTATIIEGGRITVPRAERRRLGLARGDLVRVRLLKEHEEKESTDGS